MINVKQIQNGARKKFEKIIVDSNNNLISKATIIYPIYKVERDKFEYIILYDDQMNVIHEVFEYLNKIMVGSINSRFKAATALRLLYIFCKIYSYDVYQLNEIIIQELKQFLIGTSLSNININYRTPKTINGYLAVYRDFFKKMNIKCEALFRTNANLVVQELEFFSDSKHKMATRYDANVKTSDGPFALEIPKYISPDEFKKIFTFLVKTNDKQAQFIICLMYIYGLRLGEVLGLTIEDVTEMSMNNGVKPILVLKNRISDKPFQCCKNLPHINDSRLYSSNSFKNSCAIIQLYDNWHFYRSLIDFIETDHIQLKRKYPKNYEQTKADITTKNFEFENHYLFLNKYGKILTSQTWNNHLKKIFTSVGIPIDKGVKSTNLSHRFRHGFAMFHSHFSPKKVKALELQKMMRHRSICSTAVYYNPTNEDRVNIQNEFIKEIFKQIPELEKIYEAKKIK